MHIIPPLAGAAASTEGPLCSSPFPEPMSGASRHSKQTLNIGEACHLQLKDPSISSCIHLPLVQAQIILGQKLNLLLPPLNLDKEKFRKLT